MIYIYTKVGKLTS